MDGKQFHIRTLTVAAVLAVLLAVFAGVLYYLQIVRGEEYRAASTVRNVNVETVEAARGELLDRYGRTLVSNRPPMRSCWRPPAWARSRSATPSCWSSSRSTGKTA